MFNKKKFVIAALSALTFANNGTSASIGKKIAVGGGILGGLGIGYYLINRNNKNSTQINEENYIKIKNNNQIGKQQISKLKLKSVKESQINEDYIWRNLEKDDFEIKEKIKKVFEKIPSVYDSDERIQDIYKDVKIWKFTKTNLKNSRNRYIANVFELAKNLDMSNIINIKYYQNKELEKEGFNVAALVILASDALRVVDNNAKSSDINVKNCNKIPFGIAREQCVSTKDGLAFRCLYVLGESKVINSGFTIYYRMLDNGNVKCMVCKNEINANKKEISKQIVTFTIKK